MARGARGDSLRGNLLQQIINGLTLGSVYALVALGYTMVYGIIGLINFAHGEVGDDRSDGRAVGHHRPSRSHVRFPRS